MTLRRESGDSAYTPMKRKESSPLNYLGTILATMAIAGCILIFVGQLVCVMGDSMMPTYKNSDILVIEKISNTYNRFDVVTIKKSDKLYIKRVIGLPGDDVLIKDGAVYVNSEKLNDVIADYILEAGMAAEPIILRENEYFVLGDNRNNSTDSRNDIPGIIKSEEIFGKVVCKLPI